MAGSRVNLGNGAPRGSSGKKSKGRAMKKAKGGAAMKPAMSPPPRRHEKRWRGQKS